MIDKEKIMDLTEQFLYAIGEDPTREGLLETPKRVADMCEELFIPNKKDMKYTSFSDVEYNGMIIVKDIDFSSLCEHHLLPFIGKVHIGYIPNEKVIGLSKVARIVEKCSKGLRLQETLMKAIINEIQYAISPKGVAICIEAKHLCMCMRGIKKINSNTVTTLFEGLCNTREMNQTFMSIVLK